MHPEHATTAGSGASIFDWFTGYGSYQNLVHCMGSDYLWIGVTVMLDLAVAAGYVLIAKHWWRNERTLPRVPARKALASMRNIFLFCGICGYLFIPIKMIWPAWRLYDLFMVALVYFTWKYAWGAADLKVIYTELGRTSKLQEELEASRAESSRKSFFLNALSHDLRTPLNGMVMQANLAEISAQSGDRETLEQSLKSIRACAVATGDLLGTLLTYARLDADCDDSAEGPFDLRQALECEVESQRAAAIEKGLTLRLTAPADLRVKVNRTHLQRIMANLLSNAMKFTERGGIRVEVDHAGRAVEIHVIDTGIGIAAADVPKLFDEFFQVHNNERDRRRGFGLGLAIAKRFAERMGGDISVQSAVGEGTRFTLALPDALAEQPVVAADAPGREQPPLVITTG